MKDKKERIKHKLKCTLCGTIFDPCYSKSDIEAMKGGYSIPMRCVNKKCDNFLYSCSHSNENIINSNPKPMKAKPTMEEQLISFKTANLAKEKGFDINDTKYIHHKSKIHEPHTLFPRNSAAMADGDIKEYYSAPTQSLLQRWIREKKKWHIIIEIEKMFISLEKRFYGQIWNEDSRVRIDIQLKKTYEEVLEECLFEALKQI